MSAKTAKKIYLSVFKGMLVILFGGAALFYPEISIQMIADLFSVFVIAGGVLLTITYLKHRRHQHSWLWLAEGIIDIAAGIYVMINPEISDVFLFGVIGIWAILMGLVMLIYFYHIRRIMEFVGYLILTVGGLSMISGFLILLNPFESTAGLMILTGIFAILYGMASLFKTPRPFGV